MGETNQPLTSFSLSYASNVADCRQETNSVELLDHTECKSLVLPPEILYDIIGDVVASYIDLCFTAPIPLGCETTDVEVEVEQGEEGNTRNLDGHAEAAGELPINFVLPLFFATHSFRDITYEILAKVLEIETRSDGRQVFLCLEYYISPCKRCLQPCT
jgi:hypothetical protein